MKDQGNVMLHAGTVLRQAHRLGELLPKGFYVSIVEAKLGIFSENGDLPQGPYDPGFDDEHLRRIAADALEKVRRASIP